MKIKIFLVLILTLVFIQLAGQDYFFRQYGPADGLGNSFIYSLNQGNDGYLWIGTAEGLYRFNGFEFQHFTERDSLTENFITTIYKDFSGGLWLGHMNSGITYVKNSRFSKVVNSLVVNSAITSITEADTGTIWFSTQNGNIIVLNSNKKLVSVPTTLNDELIFKIKHISAKYFLVGTQENLYIMEYQKDSNSLTEKMKIKNYPPSRVVDIIKIKEGEYFVLSRDKGIFHLSLDLTTLSCNLSETYTDQNGILDNIQGALIVKRNELWVNTMGKGIIIFQIGKESGRLLPAGYINSETGLKSNEVKCLFEDREGNVWLGMYGGGLLRLVDDNIKFLSYSARIGSNHIYALSRDSGNIWIASDNLIARVTPEHGQILKSFSFPTWLSGSRVNTIYYSSGGLIYLGFEKEGVYAFNPVTENFAKVYLSNDALENSINHITGKGNTLWISTKKGACKLNSSTGIRKWFNKNNGLPNNNIQQLFIDSNGRVLVGTMCNSIFYISPDDKITTLNTTSSFGQNNVVSFAEDNSGSLWVATYGNGVYRFKPDANLNYTFSSGLVSDYCYSLVFDKSHKILVGHRGGFSQIDTETGKIRNYIYNEGIKSTSDFYSNAVLSDSQNNIWFGTSEGLVKLLSQIITGRQTPPKLHIDAVYINKVKTSFDKNITLRSGNYEIKIEFTGINLSNPDAVNYQTILEGYSPNWSDLSTRRSVVYE
jgi:ligand-binding sensor domain-containing protein